MRAFIVSSKMLMQPLRGKNYSSLAAEDHIGGIERAEKDLALKQRGLKAAQARCRAAKKRLKEAQQIAADNEAKGLIVRII